MKFQENPASSSQAVPCGWTQTDRHVEAKLIFAVLQMCLKLRQSVYETEMSEFQEK